MNRIFHYSLHIQLRIMKKFLKAIDKNAGFQHLSLCSQNSVLLKSWRASSLDLKSESCRRIRNLRRFLSSSKWGHGKHLCQSVMASILPRSCYRFMMMLGAECHPCSSLGTSEQLGVDIEKKVPPTYYEDKEHQMMYNFCWIFASGISHRRIREENCCHIVIKNLL